MQKVSRNAMSRSRFEVIEATRPVLETEADFVAEINRLAGRVDELYWQIGELLIEARAKLEISDDYWEDWVDTHLSFNRKTAHKIMTATKLLKSGEIPADRLPPGYTLVYEIASIKPEYRPLALPHIRPDMRREDITQLKREVMPPKVPRARSRRSVEAALRRVRAAIARLVRQQEDLERELEEMEG